MRSNGEVEGPDDHAQARRGRKISQRPMRQPASASRPPPTIVRRQQRVGGGEQQVERQRHHDQANNHCDANKSA